MNRKKYSIIIACLLVLIFTCQAVSAASSVDMSKNMDMTGNKLIKKYNLKYYTEEESFKLYTEDGDYGTNMVQIVTNHFNTKGAYLLTIFNAKWNVYGVKVGMKRSKVYKIASAKFKNQKNKKHTRYKNGGYITADEFKCKAWRLTIHYNASGKVEYIHYNTKKYDAAINDYWSSIPRRP